ncbi:hypothetical protein HanRHA438_Chr15g0715531 [Helianthus annuus]|nr:hypothetical protein HanRHA438_Chr15g0715531 [Helianthus annuus]
MPSRGGYYYYYNQEVTKERPKIAMRVISFLQIFLYKTSHD